MKKIGFAAITVVVTMFVLTACEKSDVTSVGDIEGTYVGTLINYDSQKKENSSKTSEEAFADISNIGNGIIQVHFYNSEVDTTFKLNYFGHNSSVLVCFDGLEFENMYGHKLGEGHMNGGMMGDMQNNETEWMHHLNDEHLDGDEHFGGFDTVDHTFNYRFQMMEGDKSNYFQFQGEKQ